MSDREDDVAIVVVNPTLSSRPSPPTPYPNLTDGPVSRTELPLVAEGLPTCSEGLENDNKCTDIHVENDFADSNDQGLEDQFDSKGTETLDKCDGFDNDNYSYVSTDDTFQNSSSESGYLETTKMGNQSGKKKGGSDEDTPDETRTKCCEIPKKKLKDRNSKISKSSRSEDNDYDDDEVYPFENRSKSELDDHDTVELDPFEIIETDDIKFIAGAGTSDVIRNVSESKFKAIPEDSILDEDEELKLFEQDEETILKETVPIDKGDGILESGTTTAHSTFEFRQVKTKGKFKMLRDEAKPTYENVDVIPNNEVGNTSKTELIREASQSSSSSKTSSGSSSQSSSRNSSKDPIPKPARKGKIKKDKENTELKSPPATKAENTRANHENKKDKPDENEMKRQTGLPINSKAVILTQTMFSNPKKKKEVPEVRKASLDSQNTYENVNLCAILTPTGIVIGHKKTTDVNTAGNIIQSIDTSKDEAPETNNDTYESATAVEKTSVDDTSASPQVETAIYETLNSVSLEERSCQPQIILTSCKDELSATETSRELPSELHEDNHISSNHENDPNVLQVEGQEEHVPPPSPQSMGILEEEEEEEEDYDEEDQEEEFEDNDCHMNRKSADMVDFTENVCKRLSQLLESMPSEDDVDDDISDSVDDVLDKTLERDSQSIHIYEEVDDARSTNELTNNGEIERTETFVEVETPEMVSSIIKFDSLDKGDYITMHRNDSANTLKRISGDSNTYPLTEFHGSSDDDLPEYFDPRSVSTDTEKSAESTYTRTTFSEAESCPKRSRKHDYEEMEDWNTYASLDSYKPPTSLQSLHLSQPTKVLVSNRVEDLQDITPTAEASQELSALPEYANAEEEASLQFNTFGRRSITYTESDLDISEHRDDLSTDSMLADDEDEETMEILFTKTYTEPQEGAEVFLSCTVVNSAYKEKRKKSDTWLSDEALQYFEANAAEVMSTAFMKAKREMKDIQICIQNLRHQMEHFHGDCDDVSLPDLPVDSLSPDYLPRKAVTD